MSLAGRSALCIVVALAVVATTVVVAPSIAMYVIKTNVARRARTCTSITWPCAANLAISARTRVDRTVHPHASYKSSEDTGEADTTSLQRGRRRVLRPRTLLES